MADKKLTTRRHFLKSLALGSAFISYWPYHMRMAIASEPTNQHFKTVYLFDEEQWYLQNTEIYAKSIKGYIHRYYDYGLWSLLGRDDGICKVLRCHYT